MNRHELFLFLFYYKQQMQISITTLYITTLSFYVIYTATCFDIYMSLSGRYKVGNVQM
jgi:hypothetical protein